MMARRGSVIAHTLVLGSGIALASGTASATATTPECFGGAPELVVRNQPQAWELQVHGRTLLWTSRGRIRSLDLDAGAVATVGTGEIIRAVDDRHVFTISAHNQLLMLDRRTRKQRMLVDGRRTLEIALVSSSVGVHGGYVVLRAHRTQLSPRRGRRSLPRADRRRGARPSGWRLNPTPRRPSSSRAAPSCGSTPSKDAFIIHQRPLGRGPTRARRTPAGGRCRIATSATPPAGACDWWATSCTSPPAHGIWSVALDRQEPARERVSNASPPARPTNPRRPWCTGRAPTSRRAA